jgi:TonB family protein
MMHGKAKRLALFGFIVFLVASAAFHFTAGSAVATFFPAWQSQKLPDQAISIISLSREAREQPTPKPTPPPPLPKIVQRTSTHMAPIKYKELTQAQQIALRTIRPPARRTSSIHLVGHKLNKPGTKEAPGVTNIAQPTPSPGVAGAKVDTGGTNDDVNGAQVWGDNNPVRVLKQAALTAAATPARPARIEVDVDPDGKVTDVSLVQSSGDPNFDALALDAARRTVFVPATLNGIPVHGSIILEYPPPAATT